MQRLLRNTLDGTERNPNNAKANTITSIQHLWQAGGEERRTHIIRSDNLDGSGLRMTPGNLLLLPLPLFPEPEEHLAESHLILRCWRSGTEVVPVPLLVVNQLPIAPDIEGDKDDLGGTEGCHLEPWVKQVEGLGHRNLVLTISHILLQPGSCPQVFPAASLLQLLDGNMEGPLQRALGDIALQRLWCVRDQLNLHVGLHCQHRPGIKFGEENLTHPSPWDELGMSSDVEGAVPQGEEESVCLGVAKRLTLEQQLVQGRARQKDVSSPAPATVRTRLRGDAHPPQQAQELCHRILFDHPANLGWVFPKQVLNPLVKPLDSAQGLLCLPCVKIGPHSNDVEAGGQLWKVQGAQLTVWEVGGARGGTLVPLEQRGHGCCTLRLLFGEKRKLL